MRDLEEEREGGGWEGERAEREQEWRVAVVEGSLGGGRGSLVGGADFLRILEQVDDDKTNGRWVFLRF